MRASRTSVRACRAEQLGTGTDSEDVSSSRERTKQGDQVMQLEERAKYKRGRSPHRQNLKIK
jgi:hypothetical protein